MKREESLKIGEKIGLSRDGKGPTYKTMLEDITDEGYYVVSVPLYRGIPVIFRVGQEIEFYYYRYNGQFGISVIIRNLPLKGNVRYLELEQVSNPWKLQRRDCYRLPISISALMQQDDEAAAAPDWVNASTLNISENGASLKSPRKYETGVKLLLRITLPRIAGDDATQLEIMCIVRQTETIDAVEESFRLGVEFFECPPETKRRIARFILKQQQHLRLILTDDNS